MKRKEAEATHRQMSRASEWTIRFSLLCAALVVFAVFTEVGFRLWLRARHDKPLRLDRPTVYYGAPAPASPFDYSYSVEKPANTFRIAAIGDSFTYPTHLQFDDTYSKRLERMLNLTPASERRLRAEVMNFGQMGASSKSEIPILERALRYSPDLIVLEITLNDPEPNSLNAERRANPRSYRFGKLEITKETHPVLYHWKSLGYLVQRIHNNGTLSELIRYYEDMYRSDERWPLFTASLKQMKQLADENGVPIVAMVFPLFYTPLEDSYPFKAIHQQITSYLSAIGVPSLDLFDSFAGLPPDRLTVIPTIDSHPNEIAHRIVADSLYQWLETTKKIPESFWIRTRYYRRGTRAERIPAANDYPLNAAEFPVERSTDEKGQEDEPQDER
ncbi:MAG: SGNH/GDSL hydrolase family protein [Bdellovibrionota bacterium]